MGETVRVPDPVYQRIERESDRQDVSMGAIVRDWMDKADRLEEVNRR